MSRRPNHPNHSSKNPTLLRSERKSLKRSQQPLLEPQKNQIWRTEPEIDSERQEELKRCRDIVPDIKSNTYPFSGMKLNRADMEWLLATHDDGRGPIEWTDENDRKREGLDVRGADLTSTYNICQWHV